MRPELVVPSAPVTGPVLKALSHAVVPVCWLMGAGEATLLSCLLHIKGARRSVHQQELLKPLPAVVSRRPSAAFRSRV